MPPFSACGGEVAGWTQIQAAADGAFRRDACGADQRPRPMLPQYRKRPWHVRLSGQIDLWWQQGMMAGLKNTYDCVAAYSEGLREDVRRPWMTCSGNKKAPTSKKVGLSSF